MQTTNATTIPPVSHREAAGLGAVEYERLLDLLRTLEPEDWSRPTDCPEWDVRAMVAHVLGAAEAHASIRENVHQQRVAAKADRPLVDALGDIQIADRAALDPDALVTRLAEVAPRSVRARRRIPAPVRAIRMKVELPFGTERWRLGYLLDVIYTRDTWMHRVDIARVTGRELVLTADHDGRIVADVVGEWARRHGRPCTLVLEGPAGGEFVSGTDGPRYVLDAVEYCRVISGRADGDGLLAMPVPF
jgi:uncharacterized protein (TIGR03083 family)